MSFTDVPLLLSSRDSLSLCLSLSPQGTGAGLVWYLIVTAVSHWQRELIYQSCTWTVRTHAHATKPYAPTHLLMNTGSDILVSFVDKLE